MPIPWLACMLVAAEAHHLPPRILPAVQAVEGGAPGMMHGNTDGSVDLGVMQINSFWLPKIAADLEAPPARVVVRLRDEPCFNIQIAAALLQFCLAEARGNMMHAIGLYHSRDPARGRAYAGRVLLAAKRMFVLRPGR
jgi:soluble lytic murein transglycosylase-like protein